MIDVKHLTKWYGRVLAVDNISFHVDKGMIVGFLGPNGAGKSTTLKMLTCYLPATTGKATVAGFDVLSQSMDVRRSVGYMPESVPLYPEMRVREYLAFRAALRDIPSRQRKAAVDRVAEQCWLSRPEDMMRRRLGELSRGYKQRVGLAEVLLHNPPVLVLDEPTIGLDPAQIRAMRDVILGLGEQHTVILSSHILAEVEQTCNHLIVIAGGRIAAAGTPGELRHRVVGPSKIITELRGAEATEMSAAVRAIQGVTAVHAAEAGNWTRLSVQGGAEADLRSEIFKLAAAKGWQLRELRREVGSLEDFFVQITYQQNMQAAATA
jgi:ABC-2 type transport system ATP-binding protein